MCMNIRWRNTMGPVNENIVVVPPGSNILSFPFKKGLLFFSKFIAFEVSFGLLSFVSHLVALCSIFLESKATVSRSHFSAAVSRPALPECGHLYDHASPCSLVQQKTENPRFMAVCPDFKSTGSSKSFTANFSSLSCRSFFHLVILIFSVA